MRRILALLILLAIPAVAQFGGPMGGMPPSAMQGGGLLPGRGGDPLWVAAGPTKPTLDFDFAGRKDLTDAVSSDTSLITFSRSAAQSPGTYVGSDGLIHDAAVNLALYSEQFDNAAWTKTRIDVRANQIASPDGKQTADYFEQQSGQTNAGAAYRSAGSLSAIPYTFSAHVKAGEKTYARIQDVAFGTMFAYFDLTTCSVGTTAAIPQLISASADDAGNGWCRISITFIKSGTFAGGVYLADNDNSSTVTDSGGIYVWGAQLEETDPATMQPTAYIKTTSQALAAPRFDHDPDFPYVENLLLYSEEPNQSDWVKVNASIDDNAAESPFGEQTADKLEETAATGGHEFYQAQTLVSGQNYTWSVYAKADERTKVRLLIQNNGGSSGGIYASFDLDAGTAGSINDYGAGTGVSANIEDAGGGWYRCSITGSTTTTTNHIRVRLENASGSESYAGTLGEGAFFFGAQLEKASSVGEYVATTDQTRKSQGNLTTNLVTYSEMFDVNWTKQNLVSVQANAVEAPDGTQTADAFVAISGTGTFRGVYVGESTPTPKTLSVYVKKGTKDYAYLIGYSGASNVWFDLANGTVGTVGANWGDAAITDEGNGWYRISAKMNAALGGVNVGIYFSNADNSTTCTSDGTSIIGYAWGAQLEASPTPGPYVRTLSETRSISDANAESLGLLVEEQRANLIPYSDQIETAFSSRIGMFIEATDADVSPDGKNTADLHRESATTGAHEIYRGGSFGSGTYAWSIFAKQGVGDRVLNLCASNGASNYFSVRFDLQSETVSSPVVLGTFSGVSGQLENYGNGWFRATVFFTSSTLWYAQIGFSTSNTSTIGSYGLEYYAGDNASSMYFFGAQLETGSFPTSYIPTVTSQTRYADVAAVQDEDFSTTNLLAYSESFDVGWTAGNATVTANDAASPDGQQTADKIVPTTATASHSIYQVTSSTDGVFSIYAKAAGYDKIMLWNTTANKGYGCDLTSGTTFSVGGITDAPSFGIEDAGDGWFRCRIYNVGGTRSQVYVLDSTSYGSYAGDGTSGVYLWGASLTATEYPVAYTTTRNLLTDSQDFERSSWVKLSGATIDNDVAQAPDGTLTADRLNFTGSLSRVEQPISLVSTTYVVSVWMRTESGSRTVGIRPASGTPFDVTVTTDWQRFEYSASTTSGTRYPLIISNTSSTDPVLIWGMQVEPGTTATDYVRTVDVVGKDYQWYEPTEGTVRLSYQNSSQTGTRRYGQFDDGSETNRMQFGRGGAGTNNAAIVNGGSIQSNQTFAGADTADLALGFAHNDAIFAQGGSLSAQDTSVTLPIVSRYKIGSNPGAGENINGHIKRLTYWPRRQSDSTLQVITQ